MNMLPGLEASESGYWALRETLERAAEAGDDLPGAVHWASSDRDDLVASVRERRWADGSDTDGPDTDGLDTDGPDTDGLDTDGPDTDGPDTDGLDTHVVELGGSSGPALLQLSEEWHSDRVVIPGGELSPTGKLTPGSVAEFVLTNARTTITLVR